MTDGERLLIFWMVWWSMTIWCSLQWVMHIIAGLVDGLTPEDIQRMRFVQAIVTIGWTIIAVKYQH